MAMPRRFEGVGGFGDGGLVPIVFGEMQILKTRSCEKGPGNGVKRKNNTLAVSNAKKKLIRETMSLPWTAARRHAYCCRSLRMRAAKF